MVTNWWKRTKFNRLIRQEKRSLFGSGMSKKDTNIIAKQRAARRIKHKRKTGKKWKY